MVLPSLRRVGVVVFLVTLALSLLSLGMNQRAWAQPSAPNVPHPYPGPAPCDTTLQACIDGSANGDVINRHLCKRRAARIADGPASW